MNSILKSFQNVPITDENEESLREMIQISKRHLAEIAGRRRARLIRTQLPSCYNDVESSVFNSFKPEFSFDNTLEEIWQPTRFEDEGLEPFVFELPIFAFSMEIQKDTIINALDLWAEDPNTSVVVAEFAQSYVKVEIFENHTVYSGQGKKFTVTDVHDSSMDAIKQQVLDNFSILTMMNVAEAIGDSRSLPLSYEKTWDDGWEEDTCARDRHDIVGVSWPAEWESRMKVMGYLYQDDEIEIEDTLLTIANVPFPKILAGSSVSFHEEFRLLFEPFTADDLFLAQEMVDGLRKIPGDVSVKEYWINRIDPQRKFWKKVKF